MGPVSAPAIRPGGSGDVDAVLGVLDRAVRRLVGRGQTGQWGSTPFSQVGSIVTAARRWAASAGFHLAVHAGRPVGAARRAGRPGPRRRGGRVAAGPIAPGWRGNRTDR